MSEVTAGHTQLELSGRVLHDAIDGEVIVIDLTTGTYYSLRGSAAEMWGVLQRSPGATRDDLAEALLAGYETNGHELDAVASFLDKLHEEGLVNVVEGTQATVAPAPRADAAGVFAAPVLEKFTDMQDLVLIDPVHEVTEAGWPNVPGGHAA